MIYVSNAFSPSMIKGVATITLEEIPKEDFVNACKVGISIVGHPEIAKHFNVEFNRIGINLYEGDILYIVTPTFRQNKERYEFVPEEEGYTYRKITVEKQKELI